VISIGDGYLRWVLVMGTDNGYWWWVIVIGNLMGTGDLVLVKVTGDGFL
jgi:hypothetical protein